MQDDDGEPDDHPLARFGWDASWERAWQENLLTQARDHLVPARITCVHRGACDVQTPVGPQPVRIDQRVGEPATGDWGALDLDGAEAVLVGLLPRRTTLDRAAVGGTSRSQTLAANVDTVVVVIATDSRTELTRVERFLALAWESGAGPVVALTKADLLDDARREQVVADVASAAPGVRVVAVSATTGDGLVDLVDAMTGTVVFLGSSGAGKSTLANALLGQDRFATGGVRGVDGKGRHTTVHRELVALSGGLVLIDTPGLRSVGLADLDAGLHRAFADVEDLAVDCRFADCAHEGEPGCAVRAAIGAGLLLQRRLDSYRRLEREQQHFAARTDARARAELTRRWKAVARQQRAHRPRP